MAKPIIIVSCIRAFRGGVIEIVNDCLKELAANFSSQYDIKALVYKKELYDLQTQIEFVEFPKSRISFLHRMYYEYVQFRQLSKKWKPVLWLSMQDTAPNVQAAVRAVYFHNALVIEKPKKQFLFRQPRLFVLHFLYNNFYTKGIRNYNWVLVQQRNFAQAFTQKYNIADHKIIVLPPDLRMSAAEISAPDRKNKVVDKYQFIYPATPFLYKNFEIIIDAVKYLTEITDKKFEVFFTIDGQENSYTKSIRTKSANLPIRFIGFLPKNELQQYYDTSQCLLFPSVVESWGLPLTAFAAMSKPILAADLPYANETLANYKMVKFFDPASAGMLANAMLQILQGTIEYSKPFVPLPTVSYNHASGWTNLLQKFLLPSGSRDI